MNATPGHRLTIELGEFAAVGRCSCGDASPEFVAPMQIRAWWAEHESRVPYIDALVNVVTP